MLLYDAQGVRCLVIGKGRHGVHNSPNNHRLMFYNCVSIYPSLEKLRKPHTNKLTLNIFYLPIIFTMLRSSSEIFKRALTCVSFVF